MHHGRGMNPTLIVALLAQAVPPPPALPPQPQPLQIREVFWGDRHGVLRHRPVAFLGERPVEGAEFYRVVGRKDLADEYEQRASNGRALVGVGGAVALLGLIGVAVMAHDGQSCTDPTTGCQTQADPALAAISVVGLLGGGVMMLAGASVVPDPLSDEELRALVAAHNRQLSPPADPGPTWVKPTATLSSRAALLGVTGRF
jgi:hypothetical protein